MQIKVFVFVLKYSDLTNTLIFGNTLGLEVLCVIMMRMDILVVIKNNIDNNNREKHLEYKLLYLRLQSSGFISVMIMELY